MRKSFLTFRLSKIKEIPVYGSFRAQGFLLQIKKYKKLCHIYSTTISLFLQENNVKNVFYLAYDIFFFILSHEKEVHIRKEAVFYGNAQ